MTNQKLWKIKPRSPLSSQLAREAGLTPLQAQLLINRDICDPQTAETFLHPRLTQLANPLGLKGMTDALRVITQAIDRKQKITIFGDYDADGLTATALLVRFFASLNVTVSYYIPHRIKEGYGLNRRAIETIAGDGTGLIITVDCGISNQEEVTLAKKLGLSVVVTDHHQVPNHFHAKCPVIDPQQPDCSFPFKELSGVGLAFFLTVALRTALRDGGWFNTIQEPDLRDYLDLVALGTVADRVPLLDQNRILVSCGMSVMARSRWPGIRAIKEVADVGSLHIKTDDLAFRLAPRLNAPGRMGDPGPGIQVLLVEEPRLAVGLASDVNGANSRRQNVEKQIFDQIEKRFVQEGGIGDLKTLVVTGENWHPGVLGIVASRLVDKYHRPALVLNVHDGMAVGSGRSLGNFNLYRAINQLEALFERFGGHARAAGFALQASNIDRLKSELEKIAAMTLRDEDLIPTLDVDAEIMLDHITPEAISQLEALAPFGEANPEPFLLARSLKVLNAAVVGERHLRLRVSQGGKTFEAIGFGLSNKKPHVEEKINMVFTPEINRWQGHEKVQLRIIDLDTPEVSRSNP